jgi:hypothetical protein
VCVCVCVCMCVSLSVCVYVHTCLCARLGVWVPLMCLAQSKAVYKKSAGFANAAGPGTSFPAGMWNWFAQLMSLQRRQGLDDDLNLYYAVNTALFDASVGAWTQKRLIAGFRPLTAVRF